VIKILALFPGLALRIRVPLAAGACAAVAAIVYTLLTGAEVPTVRACVAALLVLVALAAGREPLSLRLLAAGAMFVLIFWPQSLAGPSFQLSFAAVATIVGLHESAWMQRFSVMGDAGMLQRLGLSLLSLLITGLAIELVLAPIALFHFHKSGVYGALANIVAIPLTTFLIMPAQIVALLLDGIQWGKPFWWLAGQGVSLILSLAHFVESSPGSILALPSMPRWGFALIAGSILWMLIFKGSGWRFAMIPLVIGVISAMVAPRPDLLVTGDGRHIALVSGDRLVLLRPKAGDYAVSTLSENAAIKGEPIALDDWPAARCSADICSFSIPGNGRQWTVMATRSQYLVPAMEMAAACKRADIVISDRYLPYSCKPRWLKADRRFLTLHGGLAFYLSQRRVATVNERTRHQPWTQQQLAASARTDSSKNQ
jgi:competence protein ComEC